MASSSGIKDFTKSKRNHELDSGIRLDPEMATQIEEIFRSHFLFSRIEDWEPVLAAMTPFLFFPGDVVSWQVGVHRR